MKKAFKITTIYLGVTLLALVATAVFCGAFLFFYREGDIFGIKYVFLIGFISCAIQFILCIICNYLLKQKQS